MGFGKMYVKFIQSPEVQAILNQLQNQHPWL
jgi:hypothetical protein